jgi:hypothetical protein
MNPVHPLVAEAIGENLDALVTMDLRGYHLGRIIYRAARAAAGEPLTLAAGRALLDRVREGEAVLLLTGFPFLPFGKPELDGIVGTAVLARALAIARRARPVIVTDHVTVPVMRALLTAAGINLYDTADDLRTYPHSGAVLGFTGDAAAAVAEADAILTRFAPTALVAIEKPGANANGVYHQGNGSDVSHLVAKTDALVVAAAARGVLTVAIGDLGNEVGLGGLADVLETQTPFGREFVKAPTGSIAATVAADHVVAASVSDWGAYGLSAMVAFLAGTRDALHTPSLQRQLLWTAVHNGALDGSGRGEPAVDGVGEDYTANLVAMMRDIIDITGEHSQRYGAILERLTVLRARRAPSGA